MKSIIVEVKDDYAAVLSDDGCITKVKNNNYTIGQVIELKKHRIHNTKKLAACAASAAILIIGLGAGTWAYASPYSYVSLDINPSIEFNVNRFDRVLSVKAVNDDGEEILNDIELSNLENQTIGSALANTVEEIASQGYFDGDTPGGIVIAASVKSMEKSEDLAEALKEDVEATLEESGNVVEVEAISVGAERLQEAKELGVTPGKLNLVEKLIASSENPDSIDKEEWLNKPVKDIMNAIKENTKSTLSDSEENTETSEETTTKEVNSTEAGNTATSLSETDNNAKKDTAEISENTFETDQNSKNAASKEKAEKKASKEAAKEQKQKEKEKDKTAKKAEKAAEKEKKAAKKHEKSKSSRNSALKEKESSANTKGQTDNDKKTKNDKDSGDSDDNNNGSKNSNKAGGNKTGNSSSSSNNIKESKKNNNSNNSSKRNNCQRDNNGNSSSKSKDKD